MQYVRFAFKNFKGLRQASLQLSPDSAESGIVTLVGLNESGKTTVLEAIDRFVAGKDDEEIKPKDLLGMSAPDPFELIPISQRGNFNDTIEIVASVALSEEDEDAIKKAVAAKTGFRIETLPSEVRITNRYTFSSSRLTESKTLWPVSLGSGFTKQGRVLHEIKSSTRAREWQAVVSAMRSLVPRIWYFPNFLFEFPERVELSLSSTESDKNRLFRLLVQDILSSVDPQADVAEHIVERALSNEASERTALKQIERQVGAEVTNTVVARWNHIFGGSDLNGKRIFFEVEADQSNSGRVMGQFLLEDGNELFSIRERSLGFRWFFVYLLLTTYRARRSDQQGMVYLLDEPASNLHPAAQRLLLESLEKLGEEAQILYTTHSHHLVNPKWLESTFVVSNEAADPSTISSASVARNTDVHVTRYAEFASRFPGKQHYFQPVLDVLDYRPTDLELVPEVVLTEGKSDYYLLKYVVDVLGVDDHTINLLPGRGSGSLNEVVRLYLGWGRNFVILLDTDQGGRDGRKNYLKQFGAVVEQRLLDLSELSGMESAKGIESLLEAADRLAFQRVVQPDAQEWDKRRWLQGIEHAVATNHAVDLSADAKARLKVLVTALRDRLVAQRSVG